MSALFQVTLRFRRMNLISFVLGVLVSYNDLWHVADGSTASR